MKEPPIKNRHDGFWEAWTKTENAIMDTLTKGEISDVGALAAKATIALTMVGAEIANLADTQYRIHLERIKHENGNPK